MQRNHPPKFDHCVQKLWELLYCFCGICTVESFGCVIYLIEFSLQKLLHFNQLVRIVAYLFLLKVHVDLFALEPEYFELLFLTQADCKLLALLQIFSG